MVPLVALLVHLCIELTLDGWTEAVNISPSLVANTELTLPEDKLQCIQGLMSSSCHALIGLELPAA